MKENTVHWYFAILYETINPSITPFINLKRCVPCLTCQIFNFYLKKQTNKNTRAGSTGSIPLTTYLLPKVFEYCTFPRMKLKNIDSHFTLCHQSHLLKKQVILISYCQCPFVQSLLLLNSCLTSCFLQIHVKTRNKIMISKCFHGKVNYSHA